MEDGIEDDFYNVAGAGFNFKNNLFKPDMVTHARNPSGSVD